MKNGVDLSQNREEQFEWFMENACMLKRLVDSVNDGGGQGYEKYKRNTMCNVGSVNGCFTGKCSICQ